MLDPDLKALIEQVKWDAKKLGRSQQLGIISKKQKGKGIDFHEVRPYLYGDEPRYIDWNVTSRTGDLYVKEFEMEENEPILLFLDTSASMKSQKKRASFQILLFLALFHLKQGNSVRILPFYESIQDTSKLFRREEEVLAYCKKLWDKETKGPSHASHFGFVFNQGAKRFPKFHTVYWISDFIGFRGFVHGASLWEQKGIWIEFSELERKLPRVFYFFRAISSESQTSLSRNIGTHLDKEAFHRTFSFNSLQVDPSQKLSSQMVRLFSQSKKR